LPCCEHCRFVGTCHSKNLGNHQGVPKRCRRVGPETRWSIVQKSTGTIIARNLPWPVTNGGEIPGLDSDYAYLLQVGATPPEVDERLFGLEQTTPVIDIEANTITTGWTAVQKPQAEVLVNLQNAETLANADLVATTELLKLSVLSIAALLRESKGLQLTAAEQVMKADVLKKAAMIWDNDANRSKMIADFNAGKPVDIDAGWKTKVAP